MSKRQISLQRILGPETPKTGLCLVATAKNEAYFWPHFTTHYRNVGITHFIVLDDGSTDGSLDWLASQPDVSVYRSNLSFADKLGKLRFGIAARGLLARHFCADRWALIADLDEFWRPPPTMRSFSDLVTKLDEKGHHLCRGLMLDCFPETLATLESLNADTGPSVAAPYTDDLSPVHWPANTAHADVNFQSNVRSRLVRILIERGHIPTHWVQSRGNPNLYKAPLARWSGRVHLQTAHRLDGPYHNDNQLICEHYKFVPGWESKVAMAISSGSYCNASIEYRVLELAIRHLYNEDLRSPKTSLLCSNVGALNNLWY